MTAIEDYERRIRQLLMSVSPHLTDAEQAEVTHLIEHDECGEALRNSCMDNRRGK